MKRFARVDFVCNGFKFVFNPTLIANLKYNFFLLFVVVSFPKINAGNSNYHRKCAHWWRKGNPTEYIRCYMDRGNKVVLGKGK